MRCRQCLWYNYDFFGHRYEEGKSFCGLHGRTKVDPDGEQHKGIINPPARCQKLFNKAFKYAEGTRLVIMQNQ